MNRRWILGSMVLGFIVFGVASAQGPGGPQTRPAPGGRPTPGGPSQGGNRPGAGGRPPGGGGNGGPQIQPPRPGGPQIQPPRPSRPQPPRPQPPRPQPPRPRPPMGNRPPYAWRPENRPLLQHQFQRYYGHPRGIRPRFYPGLIFPLTLRHYIRPIPMELLGQLPPVPPGYAIGYYYGYTVVYDPVSFYILSVLDLM
jgi:hypothetical protein